MPQDFQSARLGALFDHYRQFARDGKLPRRSDMDPSQMIAALPFAYLVVVERLANNESAFRLTLFGTELVHLFKMELTGRQVCQLDMGDWGTEWRGTLRYAMRTRQPVLAAHGLEVVDRVPITIEHLALPLSTDGFSVDRLIGAIDFLGQDGNDLADTLNRIDWPTSRTVNAQRRAALG